MDKTFQADIIDKDDILMILEAMGKRSFKQFILDSAELWLNLKAQYMKGGTK